MAADSQHMLFQEIHIRQSISCCEVMVNMWSTLIYPDTCSNNSSSSSNRCINSLAPGGFENIFQNVFFKLISWIDTLRNSCETALRSMPQNPSDDKSTLVQVMAWCRQAASHYLSQCCPRSLSPYGVTRPQWVNGKCNISNGNSRKSVCPEATWVNTSIYQVGNSNSSASPETTRLNNPVYTCIVSIRTSIRFSNYIKISGNSYGTAIWYTWVYVRNGGISKIFTDLAQQPIHTKFESQHDMPSRQSRISCANAFEGPFMPPSTVILE